MINESLKFKGEVSFELKDKDGNITYSETQNTIMNVGLAFIATLLTNGSGTLMTHMAVGTSNTNSGDKTQTILSSEAVRVALTETTNVTTTVTGDAVQYKATFDPGEGTGALVEAGLFNNPTPGAGTMLARTTYSVINKGVDDSLTITWKITIA